MTTTDPRDIIANQSMSRLQWAVVALTIALNALDGFDVLSISFASPGIAQEWGIDRAALGIVLSMELIGMAIGSVFLGGVADKIGRRPTILGCLMVMAVGMTMATTVHGLVDLSIWRIVTGLGIGGMLAAINAVAAEFSNTRRRDLSVSLMSIGYPVGAVLGGIVAAQLLRGNDWRTVFYFGASVTAVLIPVVYFVIPESVHWLTRKQPAGALERINGALRRMGHATVSALPEVSALARKGSITEIFQPGLLAITTIVTLAYFFHITTFYFIVKWIPKIVVDMGFDASQGGRVLVAANIGNLLGALTMGFATQRLPLRPLVIGSMCLSFVGAGVFGLGFHDLVHMSLVAAIAAFFINASVVGMYPILARTYPASLRASGIGFVIGMGRGGSAMGPIIAGALFASGAGLLLVSLAAGCGALVAATMLFLLPWAEGRSLVRVGD